MFTEFCRYCEKFEMIAGCQRIFQKRSKKEAKKLRTVTKSGRIKLRIANRDFIVSCAGWSARSLVAEAHNTARNRRMRRLKEKAAAYRKLRTEEKKTPQEKRAMAKRSRGTHISRGQVQCGSLTQQVWSKSVVQRIWRPAEKRRGKSSYLSYKYIQVYCRWGSAAAKGYAVGASPMPRSTVPVYRRRKPPCISWTLSQKHVFRCINADFGAKA